MKLYNSFGLGLACISLLTLSSCANNTDYFNTQIRPDLSHETWLQKVNMDPNSWTAKADSWFLTGKPDPITRGEKHGSYAKAMTTMSVRVPDFTHVKVSGRLHVQIVGHQEHNSAFIYGPNDAARQVIVEVQGDTLYVHETKDCKANYMDQVIVRLGVVNLHKISTTDSVTIDGRDIYSDALTILASSQNHTMLSGNMNLTKVNQDGSGDITILGAETPNLNVKINTSAAVNISGTVGLHYVNNTHGGKLNVIGADSDSLTIHAADSSETIISGYTNLKKLVATNAAQVYLYWVNSKSTYVYAYDRSRVGLAGAVKNLNVDATGSTRFEGQYLRGENVYVRTRSWAHANVSAANKLFAAALDHSSIYFFGSPATVSRYTSRDGTAIPVWNQDSTMPYTILPPPNPKAFDANPQAQETIELAPTKPIIPAPVPKKDMGYKGEHLGLK
jgi:hypothetical protein